MYVIFWNEISDKHPYKLSRNRINRRYFPTAFYRESLGLVANSSCNGYFITNRLLLLDVYWDFNPKRSTSSPPLWKFGISISSQATCTIVAYTLVRSGFQINLFPVSSHQQRKSVSQLHTETKSHRLITSPTFNLLSFGPRRKLDRLA